MPGAPRCSMTREVTPCGQNPDEVLRSRENAERVGSPWTDLERARPAAAPPSDATTRRTTARASLAWRGKALALATWRTSSATGGELRAPQNRGGKRSTTREQLRGTALSSTTTTKKHNARKEHARTRGALVGMCSQRAAKEREEVTTRRRLFPSTLTLRTAGKERRSTLLLHSVNVVCEGREFTCNHTPFQRVSAPRQWFSRVKFCPPHTQGC